jgi:hypothetical protein
MPILGDPLALRIDEPKIEVGRPLTELLEEVRCPTDEEAGRIGDLDRDCDRVTERLQHLDLGHLYSGAGSGLVESPR